MSCGLRRWEAIALVVLVGAVDILVMSSEGHPMSSRTSSWLSGEDDSRSYSYMGGSSKFGKTAFAPPHPRYGGNSGSTGFNRTSNTTLAAIVLFAVLGVGATVFFVVVCSKMTKKEKYDTVGGSVL